ncbi:gamma tubulin complex protein [Holotrichia oblita]|uniref:Gamma tubulin complex protein n=1 Tax=Holotrichia oblita TaxID=644536 RepID=A0ACB9T7P0_HOLOL|nr:gamma tubulin complex protein [Holotrichia oblita]
MPVDYSADYWDKKYIIRRERIPKFLEPVADIILRAGKYLNVIRQCGRTLSHKVETIEYKLEERNYIEAIENAYKYASQTLLDLVMKDQDLLGRLKSVKHYFLLDQGNLSLHSWHYGDVGFQGDTHEYEGNNVQSFEDSISKLDIEFTSALMQLLDQINDMNRGTSDYERLFNLLYR